MIIIHKNLAENDWNNFNLLKQMGNIGSEVSRSIKWKEKNNKEISLKAFERALELFDLTIACPNNKHRLKEICRARECFADYFVGENQYNWTKESLIKYFDYFAIAARKEKNLNK
jgi:hypothetical protein